MQLHIALITITAKLSIITVSYKPSFLIIATHLDSYY